MNDISVNIANTPACKSYEAWAYGMHLPVSEGSPGFSASGWVVISNELHPKWDEKAIPSREPNRREWEATIMAVKGVAESSPEGATVTLRLHNTILIEAINNGFQTAKNRPMAGGTFWGPLRALLLAKGVTLNLMKVPADDDVMKYLKAMVKRVAEAQRGAAELGALGVGQQ